MRSSKSTRSSQRVQTQLQSTQTRYCRYIYIYTHTHTHTPRSTQTGYCRYPYTHTQTHAHTHIRTHTHTPRNTQTQYCRYLDSLQVCRESEFPVSLVQEERLEILTPYIPAGTRRHNTAGILIVRISSLSSCTRLALHSDTLHTIAHRVSRSNDTAGM